MLALVPQHGAESHFVRPDGVTRSSILQAIPGFSPVENAHGVALRFTQPYYGPLNYQPPSNGVSGLAGFAAAGIPLWQRVRLKIQSALARRKAVAVMRRAAMNGAGLGAYSSFSSTDVPYEAVTALPSVTGPGTYGYGPASQQMATVAMRITAGLPPQEMMPGVAESQFQAAARVAPNYAAIPAQLAARVAAYAPPFVGQQGYQYGLSHFDRMRQWWYG